MLPNNIIEITHALNGNKYLVDVDLIIGAGVGAGGNTFLISFSGPVMPIIESKEFIMKYKKFIKENITKEKTNGRPKKRSTSSRKKL